MNNNFNFRSRLYERNFRELTIYFVTRREYTTAHEGNGGKLLSRGETQPWPTIHRGPVGPVVNSRPG